MSNNSKLATISGLTEGQIIACERAFFTPLGVFFQAGHTFRVGPVDVEGQLNVRCYSTAPDASCVWVADGLFLTDERRSREWNDAQDAHRKAMRAEDAARRARYAL
jgi:hypothetical protein